MQNEQPAWVLLTASANRKELPAEKISAYRHPIQDDALLVQKRYTNSQAPHLLQQNAINTRNRGSKQNKTAIILTGELRCLQRSRELILSLKNYADLYIITTAKYREDALSLVKTSRIKVIEDCPYAEAEESNLSVNSMKQWHKLKIGLEMIEEAEHKIGKAYKRILKIRSDYYFVHPEELISSFVRISRNSNTGIVGSSDKVFGGRRDYMMLLKGFYMALHGSFDGKENIYWPINLSQILYSDDAFKWFGLKWPKELIGEPTNLWEWREYLIKNQVSLSYLLGSYQTKTNSSFHSLLEGHPQFSSEICFAKFLNYTGIRFNESYGMRGFLYSDRDCQ